LLVLSLIDVKNLVESALLAITVMFVSAARRPWPVRDEDPAVRPESSKMGSPSAIALNLLASALGDLGWRC